MTGPHRGLLRKCQEFPADSGNQLVIISTRKVGPPDAPPKQHISCEQKSPFAGVKGHMTRRMTRNVYHLQRGMPEMKDLSL